MSLIDLIDVLPMEYVLKVVDKKLGLVDWRKISKEFKLPELFIERHTDLVDWDLVFKY